MYAQIYADKIIGKKMVNVHDIAKYFLLKGDNEEESGICNLKLQKLLYYAQGFYLALFELPLFESKIEAWRHGPVCPEVYHKYKNHGGNLISAPKNFEPSSLFSQSLIEFLDEVYEVFGQFSACLLYTSPSPRDRQKSRMPSSA